MCNDLAALVLLEDDGKQADCYSWRLKTNVSFPLKPELLNFGTSVNKQIHLRKNKDELFTIALFIFYLFNAF